MYLTRFIFLVLTTFYFLGTINQMSPGTIIWDKNRPLTWENFKDAPDNKSEHAAISSSIIKWKIKAKEDSTIIIINCFFNPARSWIKIEKQTYSLLKHEQLHFDISELYARKLRQTILSQKLVQKDLTLGLKIVVADNDKLLNEYQDRYDLETNHSKEESKQAEWERKIAFELKSLEKYSNPEIHLLLK